jgi:hypothetical protein
MTLPPFDGAVQLTIAEALPALAVTPVGAAGALADAGVTEFDAAERGPVPTAFVAETLNVYAVPFVSPVTLTLVAGGLPLTVVVACGVDPTYGVTV